MMVKRIDDIREPIMVERVDDGRRNRTRKKIYKCGSSNAVRDCRQPNTEGRDTERWTEKRAA